MNCKLGLSSLSQFFHIRLFFSNHAKLRSTTQRWGITLKVCGSLRSAICTLTCPPSMSCTPWANGLPTFFKSKSYAAGFTSCINSWDVMIELRLSDCSPGFAGFP
jgi:hypothetical protein